MKRFLPLTMSPMLFFSCQQRSPLSDVEVKDPEIISPQIKIDRQINERNHEQSQLQVFLNDDNGNSIELAKGKVTLNGQACGVRSTGWGEHPAPYYSLDHFELRGNSTYAVQITLADGQMYPCTMNAPKNLLNDLYIPEYHNVHTPLRITWSSLEADSDTKYTLEVKGSHAFKRIRLYESDIAANEYVFSPQELRQLTGGQRTDLDFTLKSTTLGKIHPKFNGGEFLLSQSISRQLTLDEGNVATDDPQDHFYDEPLEQDRASAEPVDNIFAQWSALVLLLFVGGVVGYGISRIGKNES